MNNAEKRAIEYCCSKCEDNNRNCGMKLLSHGRNCIECGNYIEGYHQAEKDLELTPEDISIIREILCGMIGYPMMTDKEVCKEVLRRFKEINNE